MKGMNKDRGRGREGRREASEAIRKTSRSLYTRLGDIGEE